MQKKTRLLKLFKNLRKGEEKIVSRQSETY